MRIGIIKSSFFPSGGGSERYTNGLITELQRRGAGVEVFASRWGSEAESSGVTLRPVRAAYGPAFARQLAFAWRCRRAAESSACDIVFSLERTICQDIVRAGGGCHAEWLRQRARGASAARRLGVWLNPLHWVLVWLEQKTFSTQHSGLIIANSHRGKEEILRHSRFPAERIWVVHNGVDCARFRPTPRPARAEIILLLVGSGFERKGLDCALRALALLPAAVRLRVAGKGRQTPYRRLAERLGVAGRVEFLGSATPMEEVYASGDLLVHPARYEPFSNACLEAMAAGLPIVTSRINGASEIVEPGRNGQIVEDPGDSASLARAIAEFLEPSARVRAGAAARQTAERMPMSLNLDQTLAVIECFRAHPEWAVRRPRPSA